MKVITLAAWRRPDYTKQVLDSIRRAHGVEDYALLIGVDGKGHEDVVKLVRSVDFVPSQVLINNQHVGCNLNTKYILMYAFQHFDYVIHLEDDTPIAPDALRYFEWASQFTSDPTVFVVSAWGVLPRGKAQPNDHQRIVKTGLFSCWGWATWKDRWLEMQQAWSLDGDMHKSWDIRVDEVRGSRYQLQPIISRSNNIGEHLGTHRGACHVGEWAGSPGFKTPTEYQQDWT